jgi:ABC-type antimicrobial peptide transport system permease subunit
MGLSGTIVGVLKNFHFKSGDQAIEPMAFALAPVNYLRCILIRLTPGHVPESLKAVEMKWKEIVPEYPLDYTFIDQDYERLFRAQIRITNLLRSFTVLALIIACLGLYGLSAYSSDRRTNEVGIRKVFGAGSINIIYTMAGEFLVLVIIAIVIATPVAWIVVEKLLNQFAFRVKISPWVFLSIASGTILIALITVSFQAFKSTGINPAEALKVE